MLAVLVSALFSGLSAQAELVDRIVAIVNDEIISQSDVIKYTDKTSKGAMVDDLLVPDEATKNAMLKDPKVLLQKMIDERIIDSEVKRQNLSVPAEKVETEIRNIAKQNNISRDELKKAVEEKGTTFAQYQDFIRRGLERQALIEKVIVSKIKISEEDVLNQYLLQSGDSNSQLFEYTVAQIFFSPEKGDLAQARDRARFVLGKLKNGGDFEKLASEYSEDPNFTSGGILGTFKSGEFLKELEQAVSKLQIGEFSNIVQTKQGLHILKLVNRKAIPDPKSEASKEKIRSQLYEKAYKKQFQSWLDQARSDSFIRINSILTVSDSPAGKK